MLKKQKHNQLLSELEVEQLIKEAKESSEYSLTKHSSTYKERKQKGEVVDAWWKVSITNYFNDEKEPDTSIDVNYDKGSAF